MSLKDRLKGTLYAATGGAAIGVAAKATEGNETLADYPWAVPAVGLVGGAVLSGKAPAFGHGLAGGAGVKIATMVYDYFMSDSEPASEAPPAADSAAIYGAPYVPQGYDAMGFYGITGASSNAAGVLQSAPDAGNVLASAPDAGAVYYPDGSPADAGAIYRPSSTGWSNLMSRPMT